MSRKLRATQATIHEMLRRVTEVSGGMTEMQTINDTRELVIGALTAMRDLADAMEVIEREQSRQKRDRKEG